jgi:heme/copper-type cytochrome/quinol oxidase subunit 4
MMISQASITVPYAELLLLLPLLWLMYEDLTRRRVLLWVLLLFGVMQVALSLLYMGVEATVWRMLPNILILLIIGGTICLYALLRRLPVRELMGMGDILFLFFLTPAIEPRIFLLYLIAACLLTLFGWFICYRLLRRQCKGGIPFITGLGAAYLLFKTIFYICAQ